MMKHWVYYSLHIPSGNIVECATEQEMTELQFLRKLDAWNNNCSPDDKTWKYWSSPSNWSGS